MSENQLSNYCEPADESDDDICIIGEFPHASTTEMSEKERTEDKSSSSDTNTDVILEMSSSSSSSSSDKSKKRKKHKRISSIGSRVSSSEIEDDSERTNRRSPGDDAMLEISSSSSDKRKKRRSLSPPRDHNSCSIMRRNHNKILSRERIPSTDRLSSSDIEDDSERARRFAPDVMLKMLSSFDERRRKRSFSPPSKRCFSPPGKRSFSPPRDHNSRPIMRRNHKSFLRRRERISSTDRLRSSDTEQHTGFEGYPPVPRGVIRKRVNDESFIQNSVQMDFPPCPGLEHVIEIRGISQLSYYCFYCKFTYNEDNIKRHLQDPKHQLSCLKYLREKKYYEVSFVPKHERKDFVYKTLHDIQEEEGIGKVTVEKEYLTENNYATEKNSVQSPNTLDTNPDLGHSSNSHHYANDEIGRTETFFLDTNPGHSNTSQWLSFFTKADLPPNLAANYALIFSDNRIQLDMLMDLTKEYLYDMGIRVMGDVIAILRYAKKFHTQMAKERSIGNNISPNQGSIHHQANTSTYHQANTRTSTQFSKTDNFCLDTNPSHSSSTRQQASNRTPIEFLETDRFCTVCDCYLSDVKLYESHIMEKSKYGKKRKFLRTVDKQIEDRSTKSLAVPMLNEKAFLLHTLDLDKNDEPVVGLDHIREIQHEKDKKETYHCFLCKQCVQSINIIEHVTSQRHRMNYLKRINHIGSDVMRRCDLNEKKSYYNVKEICKVLLKDVGHGHPEVYIIKD